MHEPIRVAIVGGGCAAMTAAFELSRPRSAGPRCEVTVYQMGHRLGGKGASGRGPFGRIEEHGLHLWMGYYENAFRLVRECYEELGRDPKECPIAKWSDAFSPANLNAVADWSPSGRWLPWVIDFPPAPGLPGDGADRRWAVPEYLARMASLVRTLLETIRVRSGSGLEAAADQSAPFPELAERAVSGEALVEVAARLLRYGAAVGLGTLIEAVNLLERALLELPFLPQNPLANLLDALGSALRVLLEGILQRDDEARRLWEIVDLVLATIRGSIRFRLAFDPRGFDAIDDYDSREWLRLNGASAASIDSGFMRSLYDLAFAYEAGDPNRPAIAAGAALRGALRAFFAYRGAFFWRLNAGMGDVVFAPLYEVLRRRGVRFEFFHKLTGVRLAGSGTERHVGALDFDVQARVKKGRAYAALVEVAGLPCWPSEPDFSQLVNGDELRREGWDFESQCDDRRADSRTLRVGRDFDVVVLGVGLGVVPYVCQELIAESEQWQRMVQHVRSVPTQALQLWLRPSAAELGWSERSPVNLSGFVEPFDTWADMTHLAVRERWPTPPGSIAYFCSVLGESEGGSESNPTDVVTGQDALAQRARVRENAIRFLNEDMPELWPHCRAKDGHFDWQLLVGSSPGEGEQALDRQFFTANVRPSDRYTQALPGTTRFRISPLDETYDNLTLAGDWTNCGLNMGCVEAAVMSGLLASHAIIGLPHLSEISGYDHP